MKIKTKFYLILVILTLSFELSALSCHGWGGGASAGAGLEFEQIASARAGAMGHTGSAIEGDISLLHYNPAGLANLPFSEIAFDCMLGFGDMGFCGFACNLPTEYGNFTASYSYFSAGNAELNFSDGSSSVVNAQADSIFTFSFAKEFFKNLPLGISGKVISSTLAGRYNAQSFAIDAGGIYRTPIEGLRAGLCLQNIGGGLKYLTVSEPLPAAFRMSASYEVLGQGIIAGFELKWLLNEGRMVPGLGVEYKFSENLFLRGGYAFGTAEGLTMGAEMKLKRYVFEYALSFVNDIAPFGNQRLGFKMQI